MRIAKSGLLAALLVFGLVAGPVFAADETKTDPTSAEHQAEALLKQGKIAEAHEAYEAAAKADPENEELARRAQMLGRVIELETFVAENDAFEPGWERAAIILHSFYLRSDLDEVALEHDKAVHAKGNSATTASLVAETMLDMNKNGEALKFVEGLRMGQMTPQNHVYHGIALARLGKTDEAVATMKEFDMPAKADAGLLYDAARLQALVGNDEVAMKMLTKSFESCPAKSLAVMKAMAKTSPDLKVLARNEAAFTKVMATESKASCGSRDGGGCSGGGCDGAEKKDGCCGGGGCDGAEKKDGCCGGCPDKK